MKAVPLTQEAASELRDRFAMAVLVIIDQEEEGTIPETSMPYFAKRAYLFADALMKARDE